MKKVLCILGLSMIFSLSALADGDMGAGGKTCTSNCFANPVNEVQMTKETATNRSLTETTTTYFNEMVKYFIEIAF
jgi:hypothetical protein